MTKPGDLGDRILELLRADPKARLRPREIAYKLRAEVSAVHSCIRKLYEAHLLRRASVTVQDEPGPSVQWAYWISEAPGVPPLEDQGAYRAPPAVRRAGSGDAAAVPSMQAPAAPRRENPAPPASPAQLAEPARAKAAQKKAAPFRCAIFSDGSLLLEGVDSREGTVILDRERTRALFRYLDRLFIEEHGEPQLGMPEGQA